MVKAATSKNVIPAAIKMILLLYPQIEMLISKEKIKVNTINIGRAHCLKDYTAQPMKHDNAIRTTERMMTIGMLTKIDWKTGLLYPQNPIAIVKSSWRDNNV